jgi:hypothetical protein
MITAIFSISCSTGSKYFIFFILIFSVKTQKSSSYKFTNDKKSFRRQILKLFAMQNQNRKKTDTKKLRTKNIAAMLASRLRSISRRRRRWRSGAAWRRVRSATSPRYSSSTKRPRSWMLKSGRKRSVWGRTRDGSFSLTSRLDTKKKQQQ